jgi:hypothetical protein
MFRRDLLHYQRCEDKRQEHSELLSRFPIQDVVRVVRRLRDQNGLAIFGELDVLRTSDQGDLEIAMSFDVVLFVVVGLRYRGSLLDDRGVLLVVVFLWGGWRRHVWSGGADGDQLQSGIKRTEAEDLTLSPKPRQRRDSRTARAFHKESHDLRCRNVVLSCVEGRMIKSHMQLAWASTMN